MLPNFIIGCGYLGRRVARLWREQGKHVLALTRGRAEELQALGIEPVVGDVLDPSGWSAKPQAATVLYAVGHDRSSGRSFREVYLDGLRHVLESFSPPERFIYVSSTSVYGQSGGEWVDEDSPTEPAEENGRVILEAERLLRAKLPAAIILRFAGIYGPGRVIRRDAVEKGEPLGGDPEKWLNLIHVEDGARAVLAAAERGRPGATYNVADGAPVRRRDFYAFLAELLGAPPPRFVRGAAVCRAGRRVAGRRMRKNLAVELTFPDYRSGLRESGV